MVVGADTNDNYVRNNYAQVYNIWATLKYLPIIGQYDIYMTLSIS